MPLPEFTPPTDDEPDPPKPVISKLFGFIIGVPIAVWIMRVVLNRWEIEF